jgi:hypothetical protein
VARDHAHTFATMANIAARPGMEINFVDPFSCNAYRFKGTARIVPKGALEFVGLVARYSPSLLADRHRAMVVLHVTNELPIISPANDVGTILRPSPQFCGRLETLGNGAVVRPRAIVPTALSPPCRAQDTSPDGP